MIKELFKYDVFLIIQIFYIFILSILEFESFTLKNIVFLSICLFMIAVYIQLYITAMQIKNEIYLLSTFTDLTRFFLMKSLYILSIVSFIDFQSINVGLIDFIFIGLSFFIFREMNEFRIALDLRLFLDFYFKPLEKFLKNK